MISITRTFKRQQSCTRIKVVTYMTVTVNALPTQVKSQKAIICIMFILIKCMKVFFLRFGDYIAGVQFIVRYYSN